MNVRCLGGGTLAQTFEDASVALGCGVTVVEPDLVFVALAVHDHQKMEDVSALMRWTIQTTSRSVPIIVTSQVPPNWTRQWSRERSHVFYQPHTLRAGHEAEDALRPGVIVVGCANPEEPLPIAYEQYVNLFCVPVLKTSYESAELSKLAVNFMLSSQIQAANVLASVASEVNANWSDVESVMRRDKRIGEHAYIRPGEPLGHLPRDVETIERLAKRT